MIILKGYTEVNLNNLSYNLNHMGINRLNIFCIDNIEDINRTVVNEPTEILFIEFGVKEFVELLNNPNDKFLEYNPNSLYIFRNSNYRDIKLLINKISNQKVDIGRGGSQKSHIISPIELRLSCYLMAMFNFNYKYVSELNIFNILDKNRYLPYFYRKK